MITNKIRRCDISHSSRRTSALFYIRSFKFTKVKFEYLIIIGMVLMLKSCMISDVDDPIVILGTVTDSSGKGIENVSVKVKNASGNTDIQTSSSGKYSITISSGGVLYITFEKEEYTSKTENIILKGGTERTLDVRLNSLAEDAYCIVDTDDILLSNRGGSKFVYIYSNIDFDIECDATWCTFAKSSAGFSFDFLENETPEKRTAIISIKAAYGISHTIKIIQAEGPALKLTDYSGKDNHFDFATAIPFIRFNREVKLISSSIDISEINYSADKQTIYFPNLKTSLFSYSVISYSVESTDGEILSGNIIVKPYKGMQEEVFTRNTQILFTKNDEYCWVSTYSGYDHLDLVQYSTRDLSENARIKWKNDEYSSFYYNSYDDCLYITSNFSIQKQGTIDIYNASSGKFVKQLDLRNKIGNNSIVSLAFGENGFGLLSAGNNWYTIDASNNYTCELFSKPEFYDPHHPDYLTITEVRTCNNNKTLILSRHQEINLIYTFDPHSKELKKIYPSTNRTYQYLFTNNACSEIVLTSEYYQNIFFLDTKSINSKSISLNSINYGTILKSDNTLPNFLTNNFTLISGQTGKEQKFKEFNNAYPMVSSNNAELLAVVYNSCLYLFDYRIFNAQKLN